MKQLRQHGYLALTLLVAVGIAFLYIWEQNTRPAYTQVVSAIQKTDATLGELLHVHVDEERMLAFYLTGPDAIGVALLGKTLTGFKVARTIDVSPGVTDLDIGWKGAERSDEGVHLLYGPVQNPDTAQIVVVSEKGRIANIVRNETQTIWYALADGNLQLPITIQAYDRHGKLIYTFGDVKFWDDR